MGLAFKDYVSSLIAGIVTLFEGPYRPGDWIEIAGEYGEVKAINMRAVELMTTDDTVVTVPHVKLWDHVIRNANDGSRDLMCVTSYYLEPHHDAACAQETLCDVALTSAWVNLERPVAVRLSETPWGTHYRLKAYPLDPRQQNRLISDLTVRGKEALMARGMRFAVSPVTAEGL